MPWPDATWFLPPAPTALKNLQAFGSGFLDLRLPWCTLAQVGSEPGYLTRLGPITPTQASYLARLAAADRAVEWRVVITNSADRLIAVTRIRSGRSPTDPARASPVTPSSLLRRVTVIVSTAELTADGLSADAVSAGDHGTAGLSTDGLSTDGLSVSGFSADGFSAGGLSAGGLSAGGLSADDLSADDLSAGGLSTGVRGDPRPDGKIATILAAIITAARNAAAEAAERAAADTAAGGCAHTQASQAYQVPVRLREFVNLRDLTCRFPTCRQPAWHCDADHTRPYDQGGLTCLCNLGPLCRFHHQLKQHPRWHLDQSAPGNFIWTTPTGRSYRIQPDPQAA
jgi:hypothetical protein